MKNLNIKKKKPWHEIELVVSRYNFENEYKLNFILPLSPVVIENVAHLIWKSTSFFFFLTQSSECMSSAIELYFLHLLPSLQPTGTVLKNDNQRTSWQMKAFRWNCGIYVRMCKHTKARMKSSDKKILILLSSFTEVTAFSHLYHCNCVHSLPVCTSRSFTFNLCIDER